MKNIKLVIMLMFISLLLVGCGNNNNLEDATKDAINKGDSNASISVLVEHGIDLESIKPEGVISTVTYEEIGEDEKGVIFYIDKDSNRENSFIGILDYLKLISEDNKIYDYKNKEYNYEKEVNNKTKKQEIIYTYNEEKIKVRIEYKERNCSEISSNKKCDSYGIVFE